MKESTFMKAVDITKLIMLMVVASLLLIIAIKLTKIVESNKENEINYTETYNKIQNDRSEIYILNALRTTFLWFNTEDMSGVMNRASNDKNISLEKPVTVMLRDGNRVLIGYFDEKGIYRTTLGDD